MAGPAARLEIDFYSDLARLQTDMDLVKRAVGGMVGGVNNSLGAGARAMDDFKNRFGEFGKLAETAADRAERAFNDSFREIQKLASNSIKLPTLDDGGANLGAAQARAAADAARDQAKALALVEEAAQRVALAEGELTKESTQLTQETHMYLAAASAARIEAERTAESLSREAAAVERIEQEFNQLNAEQNRIAKAARDAAAAEEEAAAAAAALARQTDQARTSAEQFLASLTAEGERIGKTAAEIREMEVASRAAAAEAAGFTDLAAQIRSVGAATAQAKADVAALAAGQAQLANEAQQAAAAEAQQASALAALRAQLDPIAAEEARLAEQIVVANRAFADGTMGTQEYIRTIGALEARMGALQQAGGRVAASAGQVRAGMQQLSFQIGDVAQGFALGVNPMTIFAQQGGQVFQALGMMQKEAGGFIGFMAGPWGAVLTGATLILGTLAAKYFAAGDATKDMEKNQADLAKFVDFTTGKIKEQISAVVALAAAQSQGVKAEQAADAWRKNRQALIDAGTATVSGTMGGSGSMSTMGLSLGVADLAERDDQAIRKLTASYAAGAINVNKYGQELKKLGDADPKIRQRTQELITMGAAVSKSADANREATAGMRVLTGTANDQDKAFLRLQAGATASAAAVRSHGAAARDGASASHSAAAAVDEHARAMAREIQGFDAKIGDLQAQTAAQKEVNRLVAEGLIPASQAEALLRKQAELRPILAAMDRAQGKDLEDLTALYELYAGAIDASNIAKREGAAQAAIATAKDETDRLQAELKLIGATNRERAVTLAQLAVEKEFNKGAGMDPKVYADLVAARKNLALAQVDLNDATELHNRLLTRQLDILDALDQRAHILADTLSDAFGRQGDAIGKLLTDFTGYTKERARLQKQLDDQMKAAADNRDLQQAAHTQYERESATAEMQHISASLSAFKGLFSTKSDAYKTLTKLEQVYGAIQLANSAKTIVLDTINTAKAIANALARGAANAAAGAAKIFAELGPWAFPVVAAMVATLAALGLRGLHGGGGGPKIPTAEDVQKSQGTGTVLGDSSAKSDSIAKSLELVAKNSNKDLEFGSQMLSALRSIDGNIGNLAAAVARQLGVSGGAFGTGALGLGKSSGIDVGAMIGSGAFLFGPIGAIGGALAAVAKNIPVIGGVINTIVKALFGTTKSVTLLDQGFEFAAQSVGQIVSSGVVGDIYNALQTTKKSKFFGISTGTKTSYSTQTSALDSGFTDQIDLLIGSLRDGIVGAAKVIGIDGAEAMIDNFQLTLGKISLLGLKGDDLTNAIEAVFSKAADDMAGSVAGGLSAFQKVGEGLFETLTRLARDYQVVDVTLASIGKTFGAVGVASVGARENLIDLFGGLDNLTNLTSQFADAFLSEAEKMAPVQAAVTKAMADLGLAGITTKDAFKQTVLGLDLTTEAGQQMYAQLLTIAPAFAKVQDYLTQLNGTAADTAKTADQLAQIEKQRRSLEIQLMQATGDAAGALAAQRADELAALDASLRPLQEQVYAALDAADAQKALADAQAAAAQAADALAKQRRDLEIQLMEATGDAAGALAARRADELAAMDESLRALQLQVYAAQDAAAAEGALADVHATAAEIAKTQRDLEIQLMEATGDAAGALAAKRQDELAALDPSLRALQQQVWAAQDAADAENALNAVHQTAAEIAKSRAELEIRLMQAQGDSAGVLAAQRAAEMAATDDSLKALLQSIYAAEDAKTAQDALAQAQADAAKAADDAAKAAEEAAAQAAAAEAALASKRSDLEIQLLQATGQAAEATARQRQLELAALDASLRPLQQQVYDALDAAAANQALADAQTAAAQAAEAAAQKAADIAAKQASLQIDLLRAQGHELEAVTLERQGELNALDESLRGLQQQVWAAQDAAAAQDALRQAQEAAAAAAKQLADDRNGLEVRMLRATGKEVEALALERQHELDAMDPQLRALQQAVWIAEDAKAAQDALNQTNTDAVDIAKQRRQLEIDLLRAQGNDAAATAAEHADALAALDPSLRALQQAVWDAQAATDAATAAAQAQADAEQLATKTRSLEIDLMKAMGDEIGATAASRQLEIDALDASQRALQRRIYATEDLKAAYDRETSALGDTITKFGDFGKSLRDFRASLSGTAAMTPDAAYRLAQAQFVDTAAAARTGDATALGTLQKVSEDFLTASKANAGSLLDYQRDVARVANAVDQGVFASDQAVDYAQAQLDALNHSVDGLLVLNQSVLSVHDAILALAAAGGAHLSLPSSAYVSAPAQGGSNTAALEDKIQTLTDKSEVQNTAIAVSNQKIATLLARWDRGGSMAITNDDDEPLTVEVVTP